ncbi:MAG: TerB N-terminal domain-containing protein, partial [Spirochaetaceae bacterium]|nr:TerB N-terminal domain-containing protein [Spirochaetaceae bacterium]
EEAVFRGHLDFLRTFGLSGGVILGEGRDSAALTAPWLSHLSGRIGDGKALVLTRRHYYHAFLERELSPLIPVAQTEGVSLFSPQFRGLGICFYEDLPKNLKITKPACDILILVEPEEVLGSPAGPGEASRWISARVRLGILVSPPPEPGMGRIKRFFGIQGKTAELGKYLFRDIRESLSMPPRRRIVSCPVRRPPHPFRGEEEPENTAVSGSVRFVIEAKFKNLRTPELREEQDLFFLEGPEAPAEAYTPRRGSALNFEELTEKQRAYFLYWRGAFRKGRVLQTWEAYILLYARELILSMGNRPGENFRELLGLYRAYRKTFPGMDGVFPRWLTDFAVLYRIFDEVLDDLLLHAGEGAPPFLEDIRLHKTYVEQGGPVTFADAGKLLDPEGSHRKNPGVPEKKIEAALNAVDRYLRDQYGKNFFTCFYPSGTEPALFRGFESLPGIGQSAYTAEWIGFRDHKPLLGFLKNLAAYVEYRLRAEGGFSGTVREPPLDALWKELVDRELGFPRRPGTGGGEIILETQTLNQLRDESDEVRELLRIREEEEPETGGKRRRLPPPVRVLPMAADPPAAVPRDIRAFLEGLGETEREALRLIAAGAPEGGLRELALKRGTMPEPLLDAVNGAFYDRFHDILTDTLEGRPVISGEYAGDLRAYFGEGGDGGEHPRIYGSTGSDYT